MTCLQMDEESHDSTRQPYSGRVMLSSVIILIVACLIVVLYHAYARCFRRRRQLNPSTAVAVAAAQGLNVHAMNSLPTFVYESKSHEKGSPPECAVCLSEFEENETGRILPDCKHCFHVDCIDMWLVSHCICPLCRAPVRVQLEQPVQNPDEISIPVLVTGTSPEPYPRVQNSDGIYIGCCSSSRTGSDPPKIEADPDPDIESGTKLPARIGSGVKLVV